jgi:hypothetical protein
MIRLFKGHIIEVENHKNFTYKTIYYNKENTIVEWYIDDESRDIMQAMHKAKVRLRKILKNEG